VRWPGLAAVGRRPLLADSAKNGQAAERSRRRRRRDRRRGAEPLSLRNTTRAMHAWTSIPLRGPSSAAHLTFAPLHCSIPMINTVIARCFEVG